MLRSVKFTMRFVVSFALLTAIVLSNSAFCLNNYAMTISDSSLALNNKIDEELLAEIASKSDADLIPIWIWRKDTVSSETVDEMLLAETGMDPAVYTNELRFEKEILPTISENVLQKQSALSRDTDNADFKVAVNNAIVDEMNRYVRAQRSILAREQGRDNQQFLKKYVPENRKIIYACTYTSTIVVEATKAEILKYASLEEVTDISLYEELVPEDAMDVSSQQIGADSFVGTKSERFNNGTGYDGTGVLIGVIEGGGFFDVTAPQLEDIAGVRAFILDGTGNAYDYENQPEGDVSPHATMVTSIIVGQAVTVDGVEYEGYAPGATVYQTTAEAYGSLVNAIVALANQGCKLINVSMGFRSAIPSEHDGKYQPMERQVDKLVKELGVLVVNASGNIDGTENKKYVIRPAKSLNVITVGNAETYGTTTMELTGPFDLREWSSFEEADYLPNKPDLVAPGYKIAYVDGDNAVSRVSGTSFSAPIVTGVLAQILQANETLISENMQLRAKSMLLAGAEHRRISVSAGHEYVSDTSVGNFLGDASGAGLVNAALSVNIALGINSATSAHYFADGAQQTAVIGNLKAGEKIRIVMDFQKRNGDDITSTAMLDDLNISLLSPTNEVVAFSSSEKNNVEIIEYIVPSNAEGTYKYRINVENLYSDDAVACVTWTKWLPGDVDGDGTLTIADYYSVLYHHLHYNVLGPNHDHSSCSVLMPEQIHIADVNVDGLINVEDLDLLQFYLFGEP